MPNWCLNNLTVEHSDPAMVDRFVNAYNEGKACEEFLPMPEGYYDDDRWYNWAINNWGTKWDIGANVGTEKEECYGLKATRVGNQVSCTFDSAWAPPIGLYDELNNLGYKIDATYFEPGMRFCGIYENGHDYYVEYSDKRNIPKRIWDDYNLEEFLSDEVEA